MTQDQPQPLNSTPQPISRMSQDLPSQKRQSRRVQGLSPDYPPPAPTQVQNNGPGSLVGTSTIPPAPNYPPSQETIPLSSNNPSPSSFYDYEAQRMHSFANISQPQLGNHQFTQQMHTNQPFPYGINISQRPSSTISPQGSISIPIHSNPNDDHSIHSSVTSYNTGRQSMENNKLRNLQSQINEMKREKQLSDESNRLLLQQVLEAQTQLNKVYTQMSNLQSINNDLHHQLNSNTSPSANNPDANPSKHHTPNNLQPTSNLQPQPNNDNDPSSLNQALLDMLRAQQGYFEKKTDTSSLLTKFPTFQGKSSTEFRTWYDKILSILATPPWTPVFSDIQSQQLHTDESISPDLSSKLYSKLRTAMTGNAEKVMMSKPEVWGKGLLYLFTIKSTYQEILQRGDVLKKREEFSALMQKPSETIDDFGARCIFLQKQLVEHGLTISAIELKDTFIMGLGPLFTRSSSVQNTNFLYNGRQMRCSC